MKKLLLFIIFIISILLGATYWVLFTASGNNFLRPIVETNLNKKLPVKASLKKFRIFPLDIELQVGKSTLIKAAGKLDPFAQSFAIHYDVHIAKLEDLQALTGQKLRGPLVTSGEVKGDKKRTDITGKTRVVGSATQYHVVLEEFEPALVDAKIRQAKLEKILYMLYQPHYADALIDADIHLTNLEPEHLAGNIVSQIKSGKTDAKVLQQNFGIEQARITFNASHKSSIKNGIVLSDVDLFTNIGDVHTKGAKFVIKSGTVDADYVVKVPDLGKLYFLTKQKMRGKITLNGKIKKDKNLLVTLHSNTLGGKIDGKLLNNKVEAFLKGIQVVKLTHMLYYPKIFDSSMDANMHYNLVTKKGKLHAQAHDGRILPNKMSFMLKQMANFDITREIYKLTEINSTINDKVVIANLDMQSRLTHISAQNAKIDLDKQKVDAKLRIEIQKRPVYVKLQGDLQNPDIKIDVKEFIKGRVKKELKKRLQDKLLKKNLPPAAKGLLNLF
ncbi:hypothetical protein NitYY0826_C0553 [Nitratiruptor sp. YY08-26]|uniref:hypothetical protein n=1 Tax=unclassified Nitratiruptor TaxID=2624044 RepID=UPI001915A587|nr:MULTISPECIES: hypothetical protein [unclassified Nitratiruptor]BCD61692.1 hypothetical protein NitYY0813_C0551 [Nitratiruptor sp. YY08-13]BCD65627.1 hypothetical protein NitYY0826_C0553 [Nitratiruptor sp. YY08-26]